MDYSTVEFDNIKRTFLWNKQFTVDTYSYSKLNKKRRGSKNWTVTPTSIQMAAYKWLGKPVFLSGNLEITDLENITSV